MERDLDLLQGLLVYLAWIMHHFCGRPFLVAGLNLALTLVNDLRLDRPPHEPHPSREPSCFKPYAYPKVALSVERSNDQRRAVLALYILSLDSSMFIRNQSMRWTPHMEDSLHRLGAQPEHAGDDLLVLQVRTQRIIEDVASMTWRTPPTPGEDTPKTPMAMCVRALRYNLRQVRDTSPQSLAGNSELSFPLTYYLSVQKLRASIAWTDVFGPCWTNEVFSPQPPETAQLCLAATDMLISDMPFYHRRASSGPGSSAHPTTAGGAPGVPQPPPPPPMIDPARTAAYHGTLEHSAVCLEVFTSSTTAVSFFPSSSSSSSSSSSASTRPNPNPEPEPEPEPESLWVVGLPFPALVRFFRATQILYRLALTTGDEDGGAWDRAALRERVDPIAHIAAAARCYEASAASGSGSAAAHTAAAATGGMSPCRDDDDNDYYMDGAEDGLLSFHARCVNAFRATIPVWQAVLEQAGGGGGGGSGGAGADDHDTGGIGFADGGVVGGDGDGCGGGGAALFPPSDPPLPLGGPPAVGFHEMWPVDFAPDEAWWNDMMNSWDAL
ncbi:hypothetical protein GGR56DRAFT_124351 [Xylariaceae sp. FL0804]|nr:hypothetical protein GGR56DRAFT_124351 [Xylariaceae sp. FL0804]